MSTPKKQAELFLRKIGLFALFLFLPPVGILVAWRSSRITRRRKWIYTALGGLWTVIIVLAIIFAPPPITVTSSTNGRDDKSYTLFGTTTEGATVAVNGKSVEVEGKTFQTTLPLQEGDNTITITSTQDDKTNTRTVTVHRNTKAEIAQRKAEAKAKLEAEKAKQAAKENKQKAEAKAKAAKKKAEAAKKKAKEDKKKAEAKKKQQAKDAKKKKEQAKKNAEAAKKKAAADAKKAASAPKPKATFTATIPASYPIDPATLRVSVTVTNTSQVAGKPSCFVSVSNAGGAYHGYDQFDVDHVIAPGQNYTFNGNLTITKEGAYYITSGSATCKPY